MKKKRTAALLLVLAVLVSGCSGNAQPDETTGPLKQTQQTTEETAGESAKEPVSTADLFTDRDLAGSYDEGKCAYITLNGESASCDSNAVQVDGAAVTITDEGTYILSGTLDNGMIIVDADKADKIQLVLNGAAIHSETSAAVYVRQADKAFLTLAEGTDNTLSSGEEYTAIDENNIDAAVFSKEDLTLNGSGSLTVTAPGGHGIVSKDELTITGGSYTVTSASHGLCGKDNVCIAGGSFTITSGKDGIHAENDEDETLGFVYIENGTFQISAEGDGISAAAHLQILDGSYDIVTGGGSENAEKQTSDNWGGFMGGGGHGGPMGGGKMGTSSTESSEDSTSIKAIKATGELTISGGSFTVDAADDAVHSNANVRVSGGTFEIATGDDGFHADENLAISAGTISITESYEGLEGLSIDVSGGDITIASTDDGLNAAGGTDQSGFGGPRGNEMFGGGMSTTESDSYISISGGTLFVNASGDGIDANGSLSISGGNVTVCGPTSGDTAVLDYDSTAVITGGTFIGTGASQMAQTFSDSGQGVIAVSVGNQSAGTRITLTDSDGNTVISFEPNLSYAIVILSSPDIVKGETYTITVGTASGDFEAN